MVVKKIARTFISMRQFWIRDMDYSLTLIGQFLEDMDEYRKDLADMAAAARRDVDEGEGETEQIVDVRESSAKIGSLIGVLVTVLQVRIGSVIFCGERSERFFF